MVLSAYMKANRMVAEVTKRLAGTDVLVILSDHGGKSGLHSPYGFVSCSAEVKLPSDITEVYDFLKGFLNTAT